MQILAPNQNRRASDSTNRGIYRVWCSQRWIEGSVGNAICRRRYHRKFEKNPYGGWPKVVEHDVTVASKAEAKAALKAMKSNEAVDAVILFSGTWVWAAHLVGAIRDFAATGKAVLLWTHDGSQGWRPVGGLVMHGGLLEID